MANSALLAFENPTITISDYQSNLTDNIFLGFYTFEMMLKISAFGLILGKGAYLRDPWNIMDFLIILFGLLSILAASSINLSSLRVFRVLRPLRTITKIEGLKILFTALVTALPLLRDTVIVLIFFFVIFAIAGVQLFSGVLKNRCVNIDDGIPQYELFCGSQLCPSDHFTPNGFFDPQGSRYFCGQNNSNPNYGYTNFDNLLYALLVIFQTITLEGWSTIMSSLGQTMSPLLAVFYFVPIVLIGAFFLINLTLAVINSKFNDAHREQQKKQRLKKLGITIEDDTLEKLQKNQQNENNSIKRYIVAKRAAKKMVKFIRKRRGSTKGQGNLKLFSSVNQTLNPNDSSQNQNSQNQYLNDSADISLRLIRNAPQFESKSLESIEQNVVKTKIQKSNFGPNPLINRILADRQQNNENLILLNNLETNNYEDNYVPQTNRNSILLNFNNRLIDYSGKLRLDLSKLPRFQQDENNNQILYNRDTDRVQKLIELSDRHGEQFMPNFTITLKQAEISKNLHKYQVNNSPLVVQSDRSQQNRVVGFNQISTLSARIKEFEIDKIIDQLDFEELENQRLKDQQENNLRNEEENLVRQNGNIFIDQDDKDFASLLALTNQTITINKDKSSIQSKIAVKQKLNIQSNSKSNYNQSINSSKNSRIYQNENDEFTINSRKGDRRYLRDSIQEDLNESMATIFRTKDEFKENKIQIGEVQIESLTPLINQNILISSNNQQTITNDLYENSETKNIGQENQEEIDQIQNIQGSDDKIQNNSFQENPNIFVRSQKLELSDRQNIFEIPAELGYSNQNVINFENSIKNSFNMKQLQDKAGQIKFQDQSQQKEKSQTQEITNIKAQRQIKKTDLSLNQRENRVSRVESYIRKVELKRRQKLVGFSQDKQKIVINSQALFKGTSEPDVLEKRKIEDLQLDNKLKNSKNQWRYLLLEKPYRQKVNYEQNKDSDHEEEIMIGVIKKKELELLEPFDLVSSQYHQRNLSQLPIKEITKRSNLILTGSLSLIMRRCQVERQKIETKIIQQSLQMQTENNLPNQRLRRATTMIGGLTSQKLSQPKNQDLNLSRSILNSNSSKPLNPRKEIQKRVISSQRRGALLANLKNLPKIDNKLKQNKIQQVIKDVQVEHRQPISYAQLDQSQESSREEFMNPYDSTKKGEWSGQDVIQSMNLMRTETILKKLNRIKVHPKGSFGFIKRIQKKIKAFATSQFFENIMIICVALNTILLALDRYNIPANQSTILSVFNNIFTAIFGFEFLAKISGLGIKRYFKDRMNYLDSGVVLLSIVELSFFSQKQTTFTAFRTVRVFRTFRVLRVARILRQFQSMQIIIGVITRSISSFAYITLLILLFIFIYALLGMQIFGGQYNFLIDKPRSNFDTFNQAFIMTFQLLTMENWNFFIYDALRSDVNEIITILYFVSWIFIGNYILLNLFLAILLDSFLEEKEEEDEIEKEYKKREIEGNIEDDHILMMEQQARRRQINKSLRLKNKNKNVVKNEKNNKQKKSLLALVSQGLYQNYEFEQYDIKNEKFEDMDEQQLQLFLRRYRLIKDKEEANLILQKIGCQRSFYIFDRTNLFRKFCYRLVAHANFERFIQFVIGLSSVKLVLDSYSSEFYNQGYSKSISQNLDLIFTVFFSIEALVKSLAFGFIQDDYSYLRESWNVLDFFIVFSSLLDLLVTDINLPAIKILRLLRTLRPLRLISKNSGIKTLVVCLLDSIGHIINVVIVVLIVWLMFAILGVSLFSGKFFYCSVDPYLYQNAIECQRNKGQWLVYNSNFDNVGNALETLFIVSTFESWITIMYYAIDSTNQDQGPQQNANIYYAYYFIVFILIGTYFLLNFFIGVLFLNFRNAQKNENGEIKDEEIHWIDIQKMILKAAPDFNTVHVPKDKFRKFIHTLVNHNYFEFFIMACIILNMFQMAIYFETASYEYQSTLDLLNMVFTGVFLIEMILKQIVFGRRYFYLNWNKFDSMVVIASVIDIILNYLNSLNTKFLRIGPQLVRVLRVLRISRLFRILGKSQGLQALLQTIIFSLPPLFNVLSLMFILFFIYGILGYFLFSQIQTGQLIDDNMMNFMNFGNSLIILLRILTGENWNIIMFDTVPQGSYVVSVIYFTSFRLIGSNSMDKPLGLPDSDDKEVNKEILKMAIRSEDGWVFFNELLYRSMKRIYGQKEFQTDIMKITEFQTLFKIHQMNQNFIGKKNYFKKRVNQYKDMALNKQNCNPFQQLYHFQLSFKLWKEMATGKKKNIIIKSDQNIQSQDDYYEYINNYIEKFRMDDPYYLERESDYSYESQYETMNESEQSEIIEEQIEENILDLTQAEIAPLTESSESSSDVESSASSPEHRNSIRNQLVNPRIIVNNTGFQNKNQLRQPLEEVKEERSVDIQQTIQSQVQLKGLLRRESSKLLPKSSSNVLDRRSGNRTSNLSLGSKNSKSKSQMEINESSSNNNNENNLLNRDYKQQVKIRQDLLKIQSEINREVIKDNTPVNNKLEKLTEEEEDFNSNQKRKLSQSQPRKKVI